MPLAMGNKGEPPEMSEAHLLAPWHVTGKLDEAEMHELDDLAKDAPEFALLLEEAGREAEATIAVNDALGVPSLAVWERLERSIDQQKQTRPRARLSTLIEGMKDPISSALAGFTRPQWQLAALAAVAICVVQTGAIVYLTRGGNDAAKYVTASGPQTGVSVKPAAFIVSFAQNATIGEVNALLDDAGAMIVEGPNSDMLYHLGLRDDTIAKEEAFKKLQSSAIIKLVLPEK